MNVFNIFNTLTILQKSLTISIMSVILFLSSASVSYSIFSKVGETDNQELVTSLPGPANAVSEDPKEPKTESCPLNGDMKSKKARENWETRRPLAVMIENHTEARPQSGLFSADIVYETVAEGGITRFMAVFLCNLSDVQIGPVRSARTYFIDWLSEYDALYAHVGGANTPGPADALAQIIKYDIKDLNQFSIGFPTFWRDYQRLGRSVATEHTMYSTTQKLWEIGAKRGWVAVDPATKKKWVDWFVPWKFKDDGNIDLSSTSGSPGFTSSNNIGVEFWQGYSDYSVNWEYEAECNCYKRKNAGVAHIDLNNNQQLLAKNIVIQFERESHANDGYEGNAHLLYKNIGEGKALVFQGGKVIEGKWIKTSRTSRSKYVDSKGSEIAFDRGVIWIQTVPEGSKISY